MLARTRTTKHCTRSWCFLHVHTHTDASAAIGIVHRRGLGQHGDVRREQRHARRRQAEPAQLLGAGGQQRRILLAALLGAAQALGQQGQLRRWQAQALEQRSSYSGFFSGLQLFDNEDERQEILMNDQDIDFEICLDSGCVAHVCASSDAPGYEVSESEGSRRGQGFVVGNGDRIPNEGQFKLKLDYEDGENRNGIGAIFQVATVTRPLMSVSKVCDADMTCHFDKHRGVIKDSTGRTVIVFKRQGGLYVAHLGTKPGTPFTGPGR